MIENLEVKEWLEFNAKLQQKKNELRKELKEKGVLKKGATNEFDKYNYFSEAQYKELFTDLFSKHKLELRFNELEYDTFEGTEKQANGRMPKIEFSLIDIETGFYETSIITGEGIDKGDKAGYKEYQIVRYLYYASEEQLKQPGLQYPVFPDQDRKSQKEIGEIALSAFHEIADAQMGKEWVDSIKVGSVLWNDKINPDTGEKYEKHVWSIWFLVWEDEFNVWNPKGEAILDEDGNVLVIRLELSGNG